MAAISASIATVFLGSAALQSTATQTTSVARFNGMRPCPVLRQRATVYRSVAPRRLTITAAGEGGSDNAILTKVQVLIADQLGVTMETVGADSKFVDLGADSLDTVEIMMAIEEAFDVSLEEDGAEKVSTVQEAADLIQAAILQKA